MGSGFFGIGGWELVVLLIVFLVIVGPQRLPDLTRQLVSWVRQARRWVEDSRATVEDEMGIAIDDLRQYDPRRIIREAWGDTDPSELLPDKDSLSVAAGTGAAAGSKKSARGGKSRKRDEGPERAPYDPEAT